MSFDIQKELDSIKKIIDDVVQVTKVSVSDPSKIDDMKIEDIDVVLEKVHGLIEQLNSQSDRLLKELGMNKDQMTHYLENPQNFSKEQWEVIQFMKQEADKFQKAVKSLSPEITAQESEVKGKKGDGGKGQKKKQPKKNWMAS